MTSEYDADVVIVGAGPVGLALANYLGLYGLSATVVETLDSLIDYPRGVGMDDETLRTFQALGLVEGVLPHTTPNQLLRFVNGKGRCFASIEPKTMEFGWPRRSAFIQPLVDQVLLQGLDRFERCQILWGSKVSDFHQDGGGVEVTIDGDETTEHRHLRARYLVGCDGGRSNIRKKMGVSWDGKSSPTRWLVVDVRNDPLGTPNAYVHADPRRPYVSIALPHNTRRFEFMLFAPETDEAMTRPERVDELVRSVFPGLEDLDYIRFRVYTHHARVAGSFTKGRVMIAGDAAHLMPVWQGQGYNSGIRDATNLGWKLACAVQGLAGPELIETYNTERRSHAAAMVQISQRAGLLVRQTRQSSALLRDVITRAWDYVPPLKRYIVEMRYKPMPRYTEGIVVDPSAAGVGRQFPQPSVVTRDGQSLRLDEVTGPWFTLLSWSTDLRRHLDDDSARFWKGLGAKFVVVRPMTQLNWPEQDEDDLTIVGDVSGAVKSWFDRQEGSAVVLRPDRFVAALARPTDVNDMTRRLITLLGAEGAGRGGHSPMTVALCCLSHSPLMGKNDPSATIRHDVDEALENARRFVEDFDPELIVLFGPDHLNGFLYKVMPQFCVGTKATAIGDFGSAAGCISVASDLAVDCAEAILQSGVDTALSIDMTVDHAFAQPLSLVVGGLRSRPVIPIFINAAAAPRSGIGRARLLGTAVGTWAAGLGMRILFMGSGGLSHDPPGASLATATPETLPRLVTGITDAARAEREVAVLDVAREHARGEGPLRALAPEFDLAFMEMLSQGRTAEVDGWHDDWLSENFGRAVHEIRTWIAAFGALGATGDYTVTNQFYRPVPDWIVGFGVMTALVDNESAV